VVRKMKGEKSRLIVLGRGERFLLLVFE
jgi:hypothetical protein